MTSAPLMVVDGEDAPAVVVAGSPEDFGVVTLSNVTEALTRAQRVSFNAEEMTHEELSQAVRVLAEAVVTLSAEVFQIATGLEMRRVGVTRDAG